MLLRARRSHLVPTIAPALARLGVAAVLLAVAACASRAPAPIEERAPRSGPPSIAAPAPAAKPAPEPDWRPQTYTVKRGDTLHAIALDHGLDYRELAAWNNIDNPNRILPGQVLRLSAPGESMPGTAGVTTMPLKSVPSVVAGDARPAPTTPAPTAPSPTGPRNTDTYKTQPKALKEPYSEQALREAQRLALAPPPAVAGPSAVPSGAGSAAPAAPAPVVAPATTPGPASASVPATASASAPTPAAPAPAQAAAPTSPPTTRGDSKGAATDDDDDERLDWVWPAKGKLVTGFSDTSNLKGIDIAGAAGSPVVASAPGRVVYAGTGLRGYGRLVIVKHNGTYLTAYAHNRDIVVKEGQTVTRGQKIAEMGNTDADQVKLHFEIRRQGKPVDPLRYLPPA